MTDGQLDYFGLTVNKSARVHSVALTNQRSVSHEMFVDAISVASARPLPGSEFSESTVGLRGILGEQRIYTTHRMTPTQ